MFIQWSYPEGFNVSFALWHLKLTGAKKNSSWYGDVCGSLLPVPRDSTVACHLAGQAPIGAVRDLSLGSWFWDYAGFLSLCSWWGCKVKVIISDWWSHYYSKLAWAKHRFIFMNIAMHKNCCHCYNKNWIYQIAKNPDSQLLQPVVAAILQP